MRALHETLFASILSASAVFGASAALAAAIPLAMQSGPGSMTDTRQAWPETKGQFAGTGERITALGGSGGNVSITVSMISITWTRYDALAERSAGALRDVADQLRCLALNIYHEARGEPVSGQYAVGHVVMNRVSNKRYPNSICAVVRQGGEIKRYRCQFSWWCDGRSDRPTDHDAWRAGMRQAMEIYLGYSKDPTVGAMWYHADYVSPRWRTFFKRGPKIGQHIFYQVHANSRY